MSNVSNMNKANKTKIIVFVCTGNTCRSPMAEYYFNGCMKDSGFKAISCGLSAAHGAPMALNAKKTLASNNIICNICNINNISDILHESKQIDGKIIEEADFIYGITDNHANILKENFPQFAAKIYAMPENIGDPYGGSLEVYEKCFEDIKKAVDIIITELSETSGISGISDISDISDIIEGCKDDGEL